MLSSLENVSSNLTKGPTDSNGPWKTFEIVCLISLTSLIVLANLYILYVFLRHIKERTFSNMLFLSLIASDLIVGILALPVDIIDMIDHLVYVRSVGFSLFGYIVVNSQSSISVYILLVLTAHRLNLIKRPHKATEKMTKLKLVVLVVIWVLIYSAWTCFILIDYSNGLYDDSIATFISDEPWQSFAMITLSYFSPAFLMVPLTAWLVFALKKKIKRTSLIPLKTISQAKETTNHQLLFTRDWNQSELFSGSAASNKTASNGSKPPNYHAKQIREIRAIICLLVIGCTVFFSQIFYIIMTTIADFDLLDNDLWLRLSTWLSYLNSLFDPVIMIVFHDAVRKESKKVYSSLKCRITTVKRSILQLKSNGKVTDQTES